MASKKDMGNRMVPIIEVIGRFVGADNKVEGYYVRNTFNNVKFRVSKHEAYDLAKSGQLINVIAQSPTFEDKYRISGTNGFQLKTLKIIKPPKVNVESLFDIKAEYPEPIDIDKVIKELQEEDLRDLAILCMTYNPDLVIDILKNNRLRKQDGKLNQVSLDEIGKYYRGVLNTNYKNKLNIKGKKKINGMPIINLIKIPLNGKYIYGAIIDTAQCKDSLVLLSLRQSKWGYCEIEPKMKHLVNMAELNSLFALNDMNIMDTRLFKNHRLKTREVILKDEYYNEMCSELFYNLLDSIKYSNTVKSWAETLEGLDDIKLLIEDVFFRELDVSYSANRYGAYIYGLLNEKILPDEQFCSKCKNKILGGSDEGVLKYIKDNGEEFIKDYIEFYRTDIGILTNHVKVESIIVDCNNIIGYEVRNNSSENIGIQSKIVDRFISNKIIEPGKIGILTKYEMVALLSNKKFNFKASNAHVTVTDQISTKDGIVATGKIITQVCSNFKVVTKANVIKKKLVDLDPSIRKSTFGYIGTSGNKERASRILNILKK